MTRLVEHPYYLQGVELIKAILADKTKPATQREHELIDLSLQMEKERKEVLVILDSATILDQRCGHLYSDMVDIYQKLSEDALDCADAAHTEYMMS